MNDVKDFGNYSVKNVKSFMGREGGGFNCDLYRNGKKVGSCIDDASGGPMYPINWLQGVDAKEEQNLLYLHIESLPKVHAYGRELEIDEGWFVTELVNNWEKDKEVRKIKNACKQKTLYRTEECNLGSYYIMKVPYTAELAGGLRKKYGEEIEIFNEVLERGDIPSVI